MGAIIAFPQTWRYDGDRFLLAGGDGASIRMRQAHDVWMPEWRRGEERVRVTVWKAGPLPAAGFRNAQDHYDWNKQLGPVCSVFPPPEWQILMPQGLAAEVARDIAEAIKFFTRTFRCTGDFPRRIVPVEKVVFEGQMARFNAG
jgi:hypothetical protein